MKLSLSALGGVELKGRDVKSFQLALRLFKSCFFSREEVRQEATSDDL